MLLLLTVCTYSITGMTQNKFNKLKAEGKVNDFFHCSMGNRDMTGCGRTVVGLWWEWDYIHNLLKQV
jgi:hypothetical protein